MSADLTTDKVIVFNTQQLTFEDVYKKHFKMLFWKAMSLLDDNGKAEDAVQDFFLQLWERSIIEITGQSLEAYLMMGIQYRCLNVLSKEQRINKRMTGYSYILNRQKDDIPSILDPSLLPEKLRILEKGKQNLPPRQQCAIQKCYLEKKPQKQVAKEMNISVNTLKSHIERSFYKLRIHCQEKYKSL